MGVLTTPWLEDNACSVNLRNIWMWDHLLQLPSKQLIWMIILDVYGIHQRMGQESCHLRAAVRWGKVQWAVRVVTSSISLDSSCVVLKMKWTFFFSGNGEQGHRVTGSNDKAIYSYFLFLHMSFPRWEHNVQGRQGQGQVQQSEVIAFSSTIAFRAETWPFCACLSPHNAS